MCFQNLQHMKTQLDIKRRWRKKRKKRDGEAWNEWEKEGLEHNKEDE
jgi:hypothetical protein